jgi:hypothetical protein
MVVSWIPLSYSEVRGFISHYTVTYSPVVSGREVQSGVTTNRVEGMDASTTTVEGLDPGSVYNVQVSATNGAGTSGLSTVIRVAAFQGDKLKTFFRMIQNKMLLALKTVNCLAHSGMKLKAIVQTCLTTVLYST